MGAAELPRVGRTKYRYRVSICRVGPGVPKADSYPGCGLCPLLVVSWLARSISRLRICRCKSILFRNSMTALADYTPSYQNGLRTIIIMITVGIIFASLQIVIYAIHNRRVAEGNRSSKDGKAQRYTP